jgi:hypothetical protein
VFICIVDPAWRKEDETVYEAEWFNIFKL